MRIVCLALTCTLLAGSSGFMAAHAADAAKPEKLGVTMAKPDNGEAKLICRAPVNNGMLLPRAKQCYTKAEWEARQKRMQQSIRDMQMRNLEQQHH